MIIAVYMISFDRLCAGKKPIGGSIGAVGARIGRLGRSVCEIVHGYAYVQTKHMNFCAYTCAHMHKTDLLIASNGMHIISSTPMSRGSSAELFSIAAHRLKFLCTLHTAQKIEVMYIIPQHRNR
jgi:hypothetical protein